MFPAVGPQHAGVYKSVIANKLGKAACYAHLYVTGMAGTFLASCVHSLASGRPGGLGKREAFAPTPFLRTPGEPSGSSPAPVAVSLAPSSPP